MYKEEFLNLLTEALAGEISEGSIQENRLFYKNYIENEMKNGKSEREILESLGDPRLLAKTIIDTTVSKDSIDSEFNDKETQQEGQKRGFNVSFEDSNGWDIRYGKFKLNSWYGKLIGILTLIVVMLLVVQILSFLIPILVPVIVIFMIIAFFKSR